MALGGLTPLTLEPFCTMEKDAAREGSAEVSDKGESSSGSALGVALHRGFSSLGVRLV